MGVEDVAGQLAKEGSSVQAPSQPDSGDYVTVFGAQLATVGEGGAVRR